MLSEDKDLEDKDKDFNKKGRGLKYTPPATGRPDWRACYGKMLYWCNFCNAWNTTHFTKMTEGINIPGYLHNATVNSHQLRAGRRAQAKTKGPPDKSASHITF
eukprot:10195524-Ditylum_brightwellii.AAC.1